MSFRSALSHRGFRALWLGQFVSRVGDSVHEIALVWLVYEVTGDPTLLSLTFVASFLPTVLFSLPAGALVDQVNRKWVLVGSDVVRGGVVLLIPILGRGPLLVPLVLFVAFVTGTLEAFFRPARTAIVPSLVPETELDSANALTQMTFSLSQVLFALGGLVVATVGSFAAFYVDAGSFFLSAVFLLFVPSQHGEPDLDPTGRDASALRRSISSIRDGVRFVARDRMLRNLVLLLTAIQFTIAPINVAAPVFATALPIEGELAVGFIYTALFTGITAGSALVSHFDTIVDAYRGWVIVGGLALFGVLIMFATLVPTRTTAGTVLILLLFAIGGIFFAAARVPSTTISQILVPDEKLGRFSSVANAISSLGFVVGLGLTGPIIEAVGAQTTLLSVGIVTLVVGVLFTTQPIARIGNSNGWASRRPEE